MVEFARLEHEKKMKIYKYQEIAARLDIIKAKELFKKMGISIPQEIEDEIQKLDTSSENEK
jgi:hypothetical protein